MCFMQKETVFSIQDLQHVAITCPHCATQVILDMAKYERKIPPQAGDRFSFAPQQCPACKVPYDTAVSALDDLHRAFSVLSKLAGIITFRAQTKE